MAIVADASGEHTGAGLTVVKSGPTLDDLVREVETDGFHVWSSDDIYVKPLPPIQWAVEGIAPIGTVGMIAAYGSSLKSWAASDLLDASATGRPWMGMFPVLRPGPAFLVDFESGDYEVRRRLRGIARANGSGTPEVRFVTMPDHYLTKRSFFEKLQRLAIGFRTIVIDTLSAGSPGVDQNDSKFADSLNSLKKVAVRTGAVILVLHHNRKSAKEGESDEREGVRGSGAVFNALDWCISLKRQGKAVQAKQIKARGAQEVEPFTIVVEDLPDGFLVAARSAPKKSSDKTASERDEVIRFVLDHPGITKDTLASSSEKGGMGKWRNGALRIVRELVEAGLLVERLGKLYVEEPQ